MSIDGPGRDQLRTLAVLLKDAGDEGKGFKRQLASELKKAAEPIAKKIADEEHLKPYMPDRYAAILAGDITTGVQSIFSRNPRVSVNCRTRGQHRRKVRLLDDGFINHPIWPDHRPRAEWDWMNRQTAGMRPGFFTDPCEEAAPDVRAKVLQALTETDRKITRG